MEYIYSAMLLHKAGKELTEAHVKKVLEAAGITVDDGRVKALIAALKDINIEEAIKQASIAPVAAQASAPVEEKKEKPKEEKKSAEEASAGLASLFG